MFFLFGERVRSRSNAAGSYHCAVCRSEQTFSEHRESLWFCLFGIPLLPIEQVAHYWCCEGCQSAYAPEQLDLPSAVPVVKKVIVYVLLGYQQQDHLQLAQDICRKLTGFDTPDEEIIAIRRNIAAGSLDMVDQVRGHASAMNGLGKQQIIEAAFLATYACCDLQYEDRLRINLMGNALGMELSFVDAVIEHSRGQNYHGIRRLLQSESRV